MPVETKAAPVAEPAKVTTSAQPVPLDQLNNEQHIQWLKTGELPVQGDKRAKPLIRADKDGNPPAEADADAADAVATDDGKGKTEPPKRPGLGSMTYAQMKARIRELEAKEAERVAAPADDEIVDDEAAPPPTTAKVATPRPKSTDLDANGKAKYANWEDYEDALLEWNTERVLAKTDERVSQREQERAIARANGEIERDWNAKVDEAQSKYDDFQTVALDKRTGPYELIKPGSAIDQWILKRPLGAELLYYFGKNRAELLRIGRMHPVDASAELVALESKLSKHDSAPAKESEKVRITRTPKPASEVGGRGTAAVDDVTKALRDDPTTSEDAMRRFMAAENEREIRERLGERRR